MSTIHILPEDVANRIAAGEVVERPASIVKELVENAIDAGASRVHVLLQSGGRKLVRVTDDGCGMGPEDLQLAVQRFATSKISAAEDLHSVLTMGFRGEALPSIGAVAQLQITTRTAQAQEASRIVVRGGEPSPTQTVAAPVGTTVEVTNLFYNTPAREKFLSTTATERSHCVEWMQRLALSRPDIAFKVDHDAATLLATPGTGDLLSVIATVYGGNEARLFLPVELQGDGVRVSGFVSSPRLTRATARNQMFFVNRRFVRSSGLSHAVTQAYGMLLPSGRRPLCVLHIDLDADAVDPNVHPTKIEVRFDNSGRMHSLMQRAVERALADAGLRSLGTPSEPGLSSREGDGIRHAPAAGRWQGPSFDQTRRAGRLRVNPFADSTDARDDGLDVFSAPEAPQPADDGPQQRLPAHIQAQEQMTALCQLAGRYIVAQSGADLLLINQHRAAERVLLHQLEQDQEAPARQMLAVPLSIEASPTELAAIEDHHRMLARLGFDFEQFGPGAYLLRSIPASLVGRSYEAEVRELLRELAEWDAPTADDRRRAGLAALVACHSAVKAGQTLTHAEMQRLLDDLLATDAPAVCPHGDPIIMTITPEQLDRRFKR